MELNSDAIYETRPVKPDEQGNWVFTARRNGTVYAILLAKDEQEKLPQKVTFPEEILAGRTIRLIGFGGLRTGEPEAGRPTFIIPEAAQGRFEQNYAWVFELEK